MAGKRKGKGDRKSKAENMTGANESSVEVRKLGDNSQLPIPAPDDLLHHKKSIKGWQEKVTAATAGLRNAKKLAKKAGVNLKSLDLVVSIERDNDPAATLNFFQQVDLGLSVSEESTLRLTVHDTLAGDQKEMVAKRGYNDGKAGRSPQNDYPEGSDLANLYQENWIKGQAENLGVEMPEAAE